MDILHVKHEPEGIGYERHVAESDAEDAEREICVFPEGGGQEWVGVDCLPEEEEKQEEDAEDEEGEGVWGGPG